MRLHQCLSQRSYYIAGRGHLRITSSSRDSTYRSLLIGPRAKVDARDVVDGDNGHYRLLVVLLVIAVDMIIWPSLVRNDQDE